MKKLLSLLLALAVAFAIPAGPGLYVADAATNGTAISTADDLKAMEKNPSGNYYLANDIEVPANLTLFTSYNKPFTGIFDGNGHTIKNLWAKRENSAGIALFGYTEKAILKNIRIENPRMEGNFAVGALVGG